MAHKARAAFLLVLLAAVLGVAVASVIWVRMPVETGIGTISRFDAGRVYLRLAISQPSACRQAYLLGISAGLILAPANALEEAALYRIKWIEAPSRAGTLFAGYLDGVFHNPPPYECGLPRPSEWTASAIRP